MYVVALPGNEQNPEECSDSYRSKKSLIAALVPGTKK